MTQVSAEKCRSDGGSVDETEDPDFYLPLCVGGDSDGAVITLTSEVTASGSIVAVQAN